MTFHDGLENGLCRRRSLLYTFVHILLSLQLSSTVALYTRRASRFLAYFFFCWNSETRNDFKQFGWKVWVDLASIYTWFFFALY